MRESRSAYYRGWKLRHPDKRKLYSSRNRAMERSIRIKVLAMLGGKCMCCGEMRTAFLCVDHKFGGGSKQRKTLRIHQLCRMILSGKEDKSLYQVMCHNCNCARGFYGECPHLVEFVLCA